MTKHVCRLEVLDRSAPVEMREETAYIGDRPVTVRCGTVPTKTVEIEVEERTVPSQTVVVEVETRDVTGEPLRLRADRFRTTRSNR